MPYVRVNGTKASRTLERRGERQKARRLVEQVKAERGNRCERCGGVFPHYVLDFAHRDEHRAHKHADLKRARGFAVLARNSRAAFLRETRMCELLCANCHRIDTYEGKHWLAVGVETAPDLQLTLKDVP